MKRLFAVLSACILVLMLGVVSGYLIVNRLVPALLSDEEPPTESEKPRRVYERTGGRERELTSTNIWLYRQYVMTVPEPNPTSTPSPAQVAALEDFSPEASAVIDSSGFLNLPDNSTVEDISVRKLKNKYFSLLIPGAWVDNVVVECKYINDVTESPIEGKELVYDTLLLRFFERGMYEMYRNSHDRTTYSNGLLTELRYSSTENDNSWLKTSNYQNYWADTRLGVQTYNVFIYEPNNKGDLIADEFRDKYLYMLRINYEGCFINTFKVNGDGEVTYTDDSIRKGFVDSWDPNAEGIPDGSLIPQD
ncbi:MAG: hypothetical protein IKF10_03910 [Lachnospiraceae bacterium]|nr:hypothetical protein [Lachnospiraceae bacterium]